MPEGAAGLLIWENNQDTPLSSSNLSKSLDVRSESKFMHYSDESESYEQWADVIEEFQSWPVGADIDDYVGLIVYNPVDKRARMGVRSDDNPPVWSWDDQISPYKKVLKILPFTKIGMQYTNVDSGEIEYENFDSGSNGQVFSVESILIDNDLVSNTTYSVYLYHHNSFGDYAYFRIVSEYHDQNNTGSWKQGVADESSPTGTKVISYRKVGGFRTDSSGYIDSDSVWDISTYHAELVADTYKIMDSSGIRNFRAEDIPIESSAFAATQVEGALSETRVLVDSIYEDTYNSNSRFGVELKFSPVKKQGGNIVLLSANEISLKITQGYIDVVGTRVKIDNDIYLASTTVPIRINGGDYEISPTRVLGQVNSQNSNIFEGLWRCFINAQGYISFKRNDYERPVYRPDLKGWYDSDGARCIGKFKVSFSVNHFFVQKLSVTETFDENIPTNSVIIYHGTMCPDGLIPADGKWHDTTGADISAYSVMPEVDATSNWQSGSWYEDTPNMWDRTVKMIPEQPSLPYDIPEFEVDWTANTVQGSSEDTGDSNDLSESEHSHVFIHQHNPGTLSIVPSGDHTHDQSDFAFIGDATSLVNVQDVQGGVEVAARDHEHVILITTSGAHGHASDKFDGSTDDPSPTSTSPYSSWPPYKEFIFCIKK